jgi:hypothetical protein
VKKWIVGIMERWKDGKMERWGIGILGNWGAMTCPEISLQKNKHNLGL